MRKVGLQRSDIDKMEQEAQKVDPIASRSGARTYTRAQIQGIEEKHVPWLRRRVRRAR